MAKSTSLLENEVPLGNVNLLEADTLLEFVFPPEFLEAMVQSRLVRLGLALPTTPAEGWQRVTYQGATFDVPEDLPQNWWMVYHPITLSRSLGISPYGKSYEQWEDEVEQAARNGKIIIAIQGLDTRPYYMRINSRENRFVGRADTPLLFIIDLVQKKMSLVSVARDTHSPEVAQYFQNVNRDDQQINVMSWVHAENGVLQETDEGFSRMVWENICGCFVDSVVEFNFEAITEYIDALFPEGLMIHVSEPIDDDTDGVNLHIPVGDHRMDGQTILLYARSRHGSLEGDLSRQRRQREIIVTLLSNLGVKFKDAIKAGDVNGAMEILEGFFNITGGSMERFEQNTQQVEDGETEPARIGYMQAFGINPRAYLERVREVIEYSRQPEGLAALTALLTKQSAQEELMRLSNGDIITFQSSILYTNPNSETFTGYWQPTRDIFANYIFQGIAPPPPPGSSPPVETTPEPVAPEPQAPLSSESSPVGPEAQTVSLETGTAPEATPTPTAEPLFVSGDYLWNWLESPEGPFGGVELTNAEIDLILDYVQSFPEGRLEDGAEVSARRPQFMEALALARVTYPDVVRNRNGRTDLQQAILDRGTGLFIDWHDYYTFIMASADPQFEEMQDLLVIASDPLVQFDDIAAIQLEEDYWNFWAQVNAQ